VAMTVMLLPPNERERARRGWPGQQDVYARLRGPTGRLRPSSRAMPGHDDALQLEKQPG
jgi:hypothetical protein